MAIDQKKLMGAFGLNPIQTNQSPEPEDEDFEDPFVSGLPEEDGGRTPPVIMNTEAPALTPQDFNADIDYARRSYANIASESQKLVQIERLVTLYEKLQKLQPSVSDQPAGNTYVQNQVVFNGSTEDAMKMVRERIASGQDGKVRDMR